MSFFNETVAAYLANRAISASLLVHMEFRDTPRRWWQGFGWLEADGQLWQGTGGLISVDGLEAPLDTVAAGTTFTLAGVEPDMVALAKSGSDRVSGRPVTVFVQFFHVNDENEVFQKLDNPFVIWSGEMDQISYTADGPQSRVITVSAEGIWVDRSRPAFGLYTDRDQRARFPGDRGLEQVADLVNKTIRWPDF